jgi:serine/threonine-protein kinase
MSVSNFPTAFGAAPALEPEDNEVTRLQAPGAIREAATARAGSESATTDAQRDLRSDALLGRTIDGKYRIDAKIGVGGMGAVYRAARLRIGDEVAVKILHPARVLEPQAGERFQREAQAAARLKHPNAVFVIDFGVTNDGLVYLVMELLHGESLRTLIKQEGPLAPTVAAEILKQVCGALDEAHRHQIVHRDLKPDNIMVKTGINGLSVKVLDFGIAKLRDLAASDLTLTDSVMGSPRYMSPEQCLGEEIDGRSDIYSLGVVLYEMLAGVVPFNRPTSTAVVDQQVNQPPPPLRKVNPTISPSVEAVVLQALAKRREARPQSARALAAAFSAAIEGTNPRESADQSVDPDRLDTTVVLRRPQPVMPPNRVEPPAKTNKPPTTLIITGAVALLAIGALAAVLLVRPSATTSSNNASPSAQPTIDTSRAAPTSAPVVRESSAPVPRETASAPVITPKPAVLPYGFRHDYQGFIYTKKGSMPFAMTLEKSGPNVTGNASTAGSTDTLSGTVDNEGHFSLTGYEGGYRSTGRYTGQLHSDGTITDGLWKSTEGRGSASFKVSRR